VTNASEPPAGYRPCAGAAVFNRHGQVFLGRRVGLADDVPFAWQMPQGGLERGEDPEAGARRELEEETGIRSVRLLAEHPDWLTYDFPPEVLGRRFKNYRGQAQRWFAFAFTGDDAEIDLDASGHAEFRRWEWVPLDTVPALIVPFKREVYAAIVAAFLPLVDGHDRRKLGPKGPNPRDTPRG